MLDGLNWFVRIAFFRLSSSEYCAYPWCSWICRCTHTRWYVCFANLQWWFCSDRQTCQELLAFGKQKGRCRVDWLLFSSCSDLCYRGSIHARICLKIHQRWRFLHWLFRRHQHPISQGIVQMAYWWLPSSKSGFESHNVQWSCSTCDLTKQYRRRHIRIYLGRCNLNGSVCQHWGLEFRTRDQGRCCIAHISRRLCHPHISSQWQLGTCHLGSKLNDRDVHIWVHPLQYNRMLLFHCW